MSQTSQQFECATCGTAKRVPESPTTGAQSIRTGCESCGRIGEHLAVGRATWAARKDLRARGGR